ncbi:alpha/beta hydrolase [Ornithinimicrobium sp. W1679]|uniref:alpha/beta hydrolase n=1 Tax=Ornithinimicrobium sp. W1679 TaxID=3418770 RepID=UPI003CE8005A
MLESIELRSWTWPTPENLAPVVLLHGSGQNENTLLSFAQAACPGHTVISVRGRIAWEEGFAFFRRNPDRTVDETDLDHGAAAIQRLLEGLNDAYPEPPIVLGFSNGAIAAAAAIVRAPDLSAGAILLRPLSPFPERVFPPLNGYPVLLVSGQSDTRRNPSDGPALARQFESAGAATSLVELRGGHRLTTADEIAVTRWLPEVRRQRETP